jgi:hypothetical protein
VLEQGRAAVVVLCHRRGPLPRLWAGRRARLGAIKWALTTVGPSGVDRGLDARHGAALGLFFSMEPRFWLNLQAEYDMRTAERELRAKIAPRIRVLRPSAA